MDYFWYCYIFLIGSIIGSFLNVCICRLPKKESVVMGRSHCTSCGHVLSFYEMIPILSYLLLRGKCKKCGVRISGQYPLIEVINACLYLLAAVCYGFKPYTILLCIFFSVLLVLAGIDFYTMEFPDLLHIWILGIAIVHFILFPCLLAEGIIGFFIVSVPMLLLAFFTDGFGGGDIKLCAVCGLFLGYQLVIIGFLSACLLASIAGIILILLKKAERKTAFAFGPFLAFGYILAALYGNQMLSAYFSLFR